MAMPLAGTLVPRLGSRIMSTMGGAGFAGSLLLAVLAPTRWMLLLALIGFGLCGAGMDVAMNAQAVLVEVRSGRRVLSSLHGLYSLGNVVGSLGVSAAFARGLSHRGLVFAISAALLVAVLASSSFMLPDRANGQEQNRRSFAPRLILLGSLVVAAMICEGAMADWSGLYLRNARHLGAGWAGVGFGVFSGLMLAGRLLGDRIVATLGELWTLRVGGLLAACGALLVIYGPGTSAALSGFALLGIGLANASPVLYRGAGHVRDVPAGVGLATAVGMGYAGLLAGPPLLGGIAQAFGLSAVFLVMAGLALVLAGNARFAAGGQTPLNS